MEVIRRVQTAARMSQAVMAPSGRTCYLAGQAAMAKPDIRVEIQVVAWCPPALNSLRIF